MSLIEVEINGTDITVYESLGVAMEVLVPEDTMLVEVIEMGPPGPPGPPAEGTYYVHTQNSASDEWVIEHELGFFPAITVVDTGGTVVFGEVTYDSTDQVTVRFSSPFSGKAYAS